MNTMQPDPTYTPTAEDIRNDRGPATKQPNQLHLMVQNSGLNAAKAEIILQNFSDYFNIAAEWEIKARAIKITDASQVAEMKMAREGRLFLRQKRLDVERVRKEQKEQSLREGKAIDGIANVLKALIEPIEGYLEDQEKFVQVQEEKRIAALKHERNALLQELPITVRIIIAPETWDALGYMTQERFDTILGEYRAKAEEEQRQKEREARIQAAKDAEAKRLRDENERLRKEQAEKDRIAAAERAEIEKKNAAERAERDRIAAEEREAARQREAALIADKRKAEEELRAKQAAEAAEQRKREAEERRAKSAPDRDKMTAMIRTIRDLNWPAMTDPRAVEIMGWAQSRIHEITAKIEHRANEMEL